ncbi:MAG TPA: PqqD family protein [Ktedonobacteraceae bacterium]|nr:PqqD family protein [Ktedonobacteraceae bacterium]
MLQRNKSVLWRELAGEAVLLDPEAGCSYNLNKTGTLIWKLLDGQHSVQDITATLSSTYAAAYEQVAKDVEQVLADMRENNLLSDALSSIP